MRPGVSARSIDRAIDPDPAKGWLSRILPVVLAHRFAFLGAIASALVAIVAMVLFPLWLGRAIDEALAAPAGQREPLGWYLWVLLAIAGAGLLAGFLQRLLSMRVAFALEFDLRAMIFRHVVWLPLAFYDRVRAGQLVSRANSDVRALQMFLAFGPMMIVQFGMVFLALYFMLRIDVVLTLLSITVLPITFMAALAMRKHMFPISWLVQSRLADIATIVDENVGGSQVVKAFAAEQQQTRLLAGAARRLRWAVEQQIRVMARFGPLMENLVRVGEALVVLYGGFLVLDGAIGPGDIIVFLSYLVMLQVPFRMLAFVLVMAQQAAASAHRIFEVLDETPAIADRPGAAGLTDVAGEVVFSDVHFGFPGGGHPVLDGVDLRIPAGQSVALVGPTGSGKSTLAQLIPRLYDAGRGAVLIDGTDVRDVTTASLRGQVGICFEEPFLFSASIRDNIAYGRPAASDDEVVRAARVAGADEFITGLADGYQTVVGERGYSLSGGQRQRIAIARTVLADPRVLILDDATSAIDVNTELGIHDALRQLISGRTTIVIAHRLSTLSLADRVVVLERGKVVADGTHTELMATEPRYREVLVSMREEDRAKAARLDRPLPEPADDAPVVPLDPDHLEDMELS